jgi:hypothetical protein
MDTRNFAKLMGDARNIRGALDEHLAAIEKEVTDGDERCKVLRAECDDIERKHAAELAGMETRHATELDDYDFARRQEHNAEVSRLRDEISNRDTASREIRSKFGFVAETIRD